MSRRLRRLRTRLVYRLLDAAHTAPTRPELDTRSTLSKLLHPRTAHFDRVGVLTRWLGGHLPGFDAHLRSWLQRTDALPLEARAVKPFAYGWGSTCFRVDDSPPRVLKVLRESLGMDTDSILRLTKELREDHAALRRWYRGVPRLLPETHHVVLPSPLLGLPAAALVQALVPQPIYDFLADFTDDELLRIMDRSPMLRSSFHAFVDGTLTALDEGRCLDLVGRLNLMLVIEQEPEMRAPDFGVLDLVRDRREAPHRYGAAMRTADRLHRLAVTIG